MTEVTAGRRPLLILLCGCLLLVAIAVRFSALGSDFPVELTHSESPYTDEGWYSNSAVRHVLRQQWLLRADVNEATVMPLFHVVQRIGFGVFGMSFVSLRLVTGLLFLALAAALCALVWQEGVWATAICTLLLLTNFRLFAYSRIALVELPMLTPIALGLLVMHRLPLARSLERGVVAGGATAIAALLKFSALFAGPALLLAAVAMGRNVGERWRGLVGYGAGASLAALYWAVQLHLNREDTGDFFYSLVSGDQHSLDVPLGRTSFNALRALAGMDLALALAMTLAAGLTAAALWSTRTEWRRWAARLDVQLLLLAGLGWLVPAITVYQPARYYLPPIVFGIALVALHTAAAVRRRSVLPAVLVCLVCWSSVRGVIQTGVHMTSLESTYKEACVEIASHLGPSSVLMGDTAPQIAIESSTWAVSGLMGTGTFVERARLHRPSHYISRGPIGSFERIWLGWQGCRPRQLAVYDVFGNYTDRPLHLYELQECTWRSEPGRFR